MDVTWHEKLKGKGERESQRMERAGMRRVGRGVKQEEAGGREGKDGKDKERGAGSRGSRMCAGKGGGKRMERDGESVRESGWARRWGIGWRERGREGGRGGRCTWRGQEV